jgi:hypothetical protein
MSHAKGSEEAAGESAAALATYVRALAIKPKKGVSKRAAALRKGPGRLESAPRG